MKEDLPKYITAAKAAIYDKKRADVYLPMLDTRQGSVQAVGSVIAALEAQRPIPPDIVPMLAMNIYLLMVDVAMQVTGEKPDKAIMKKTLTAIMQQAGGVPNGAA